MKRLSLFMFSLLFFFGCSDDELAKKGFPVSTNRTNEKGEVINGLRSDSLKFDTKPRNVLLTGNKAHRLVPIYKVNYKRNSKKPFTGTNAFHENYWSYGNSEGNNWHRNFMPGFEAVHGYNFVNVSHYNNETKKENSFFENPVLIRTLYYPTLSKDTLNSIPVNRNYYMVSVYDEDTNKDGFINVKDLRRFYHFDIDAKKRMPLIPENYSVMSSEYDPENDFMYVFTRLDKNGNGQMEYEEPSFIFWIDLKNPENKGVQYEGE